MPRYAISDIHGCLKTLQKLLQQINLSKTDELYLLGDYVNKGPDSKGVLDYLMQLLQDGYQLTILRGNHDQLLLDAAESDGKNVWLSPAEQTLTLRSFGIDRLHKIPLKYLDFIRSMAYYKVLPDYILVHAGLNFNSNDLFGNTYLLMNAKHQQIDEERLQGKTLVHGHLPVGLTKIRKAIAKNKPEINLDSGCVYFKNEAFGRMVSLDLDSRALHIQINLDKPYPIEKKR
jgi:serine/threonine protein phosphatase 1